MTDAMLDGFFDELEKVSSGAISSLVSDAREGISRAARSAQDRYRGYRSGYEAGQAAGGEPSRRDIAAGVGKAVAAPFAAGGYGLYQGARGAGWAAGKGGEAVGKAGELLGDAAKTDTGRAVLGAGALGLTGRALLGGRRRY